MRDHHVAAPPVVACAAPLTSSQVAILVFGPHLYTRYTNWLGFIREQTTALPCLLSEKCMAIGHMVANTVPGHLPSTALYRVFMDQFRCKLFKSENRTGDERSEERDADTDTDSADLVEARICGHYLHPGKHNERVAVCPMCLIRQSVGSLERILQAWRILGGPHHRPHEGEPRELYLTVRGIWYIEKTRWSNLVRCLEDGADSERLWEEEAEDLGLQGALKNACRISNGYVAALKVARQCPFLQDGYDDDFVPLETKLNMKPVRLKKTGLESPETPELEWHATPCRVTWDDVSICHDELEGQVEAQLRKSVDYTGVPGEIDLLGDSDLGLNSEHAEDMDDFDLIAGSSNDVIAPTSETQRLASLIEAACMQRETGSNFDCGNFSPTPSDSEDSENSDDSEWEEALAALDTRSSTSSTSSDTDLARQPNSTPNNSMEARESGSVQEIDPSTRRTRVEFEADQQDTEERRAKRCCQ